MQLIVCASLPVCAAVAGFVDWRQRRIPNWLTVACAALGLGATLVAPHGRPLASVLGLAGALGLGYGLFALGLFGGGDAKLVAAFGAWAGIERLPGMLLAALAGGALLAVAWSIRHRVFWLAAYSTARILGAPGKNAALVGRTPVGKFPYGVGLGAGAATWWFWVGCTLP